MKKALYIFLSLATLVIIFVTCQKKPQLQIHKLELTEENVEVTPYGATITANYAYPGEVPQIKVFVSTSNSMTNAIETDAELDDNTMTVDVDGLNPDTKYYYRFRYSNGMKLVDTEIKDFTTEHAIVVPTLTTIPAASITSNSAVSGGNISDDGGSDIKARGVCWSDEPNPTIEDNYTENGTGTGSYISNLTNLNANTLYYVRAYATNGEGTGYGNEIMFLTSAALATVSTKPATEVTENSAISGGNITNSGGMEITARGVCWSTEHNPTINDFHTTDGTGIGEFESEITGLDANVVYYIRAYATSAYGTAYGEERSITTIVGMPVVTTKSVTGITAISANCGGNVLNDGGESITARGVCWATTQNPTISDSHTSDGTGTGEFASSITGLSNNITYYVRAYATNSNGTAYGEERSFTTQEGLAVVSTNDITNITDNSAVSGGEIADDGGFSITARGVCWSTSQNPTTDNTHTSDGTGTGSYTSNITSLSYNTTYYVRAYATNSNGTSYGEEKSFTTSKIAPTVTTAAAFSITSNSAVCGGNVTSDGGAIVTARGVCYSTSQNPTISGDHTSDGNGTGIFTSNLAGLTENTTYYIRAYASNSEGTSYGEQKTFTTTSGSTGNAPTGAIDGLFSINSSEQIYFSKGNLQYQASTNTWRFAENQYDYIGDDNANISSTNSGWIDLFGWGTSGYNHGAVCYQPWSTSLTNSSYYAYGSATYNLSDQTCQADWGYNLISNGGNAINQWRTLTKNEWVYIINTRNTTSGIRYAKAVVNNVNGVIVLPDNWISSIYNLNNTNTSGASFNSNTISLSTWTTVFEVNGAVFLPASGYRDGSTIRSVGSHGYYWSSSYNNNSNVYIANLNSSEVNPQNSYDRYNGFSVRLIYSSQTPGTSLPTVITNQASNISSTSATCGGNVTSDGGSAVTSRGVCWSTSHNPVLNIYYMTSDGSGTGEYVSSITGLQPNTTYYVRAYASNSQGTVYGPEVSFTTQSSGSQVPTGAINGLFTINTNGDQVYFSQGNLQYKATNNIWKFADNQWEYIGIGNENVSSEYDGWIDLYGWGTSGYNHGAIAYQPYSTNFNGSDYYAYGNCDYNLNNYSGKADWGYNAISNGGNTENMWRTLSKEEWHYLLYTRNTNSGKRFAKAVVNGVNGLIILPDYGDFELYSTNDASVDFSTNTIGIDYWTNSYETNGAVFIPAAGQRSGSSPIMVSELGLECWYWSTTHYNTKWAYNLIVSNTGLGVNNANTRNLGFSVRLVSDAE